MSNPHESASRPQLRLTGLEWLICVIAAIGFAFDIYELLMLPLIVRPALAGAGGRHAGLARVPDVGGPAVLRPGAVAGGIFGLLGGYLTDLLGRRRVLTLSILLYAGAAFAAGFSTSIEMLLVCRCLVFIGVCVEFVAAVAWLAELFPEPEAAREVLGYTQAFSSLGGLLVAVVNGSGGARTPPACRPSPTASPTHAAWRYTLMSGLIPALPLILIRPFLPESPAWRRRSAGGHAPAAEPRRAVRPRLRRTTLVTTLMFAVRATAPPSAPSSRSRTSCRGSRRCAGPLPRPRGPAHRAGGRLDVVKVQEIGGLVGRVLSPMLAVAHRQRGAG